MEHVLLLLYILAFAAGAASISVVFLASRDGRPEPFRDYLRFLVLLNFCVAANLTATYVENVLAEVSPLRFAGSVPVVVDLAGMFLVAGIIHAFVKVAGAAAGSEALTAGGRIILVIVLLGAAATILAAVIYPDASPSSLHAVPRGVNFLMFVLATAASAWTLAAVRNLAGRRRKTVLWFAGLHMVVFLVISVAYFIPESVAWHLLAAGFLCVNFAPLALVRSLRAERLDGFGLAEDVAKSLETFATEYGISAREMEILAQVINGRTNAEMAAALFISASTVKNHIHNIYQKCGARNRVELVRLININK